MTKVMTPSAPMTDGQIDKAVDHYRNVLRKHRGEIGSSEAVQQVLGQPQYLNALLAVLRKHVEAVSSLIVRRVAKINRDLTPQAMLDATGRKQYTDLQVVAAMPRGEGEEAEVCFFNLGRYASDNEAEKEFDLRGFKPADPYMLAAVNEADPAFADEHPNVTHWKDASGKWCYAAFYRWDGGCYVYVDRYEDGWYGYWWFAGVRK